jgi:hypothetical protein
MADAGASCPRCGKVRAPESFVNTAGRTLKCCAPCREAAQQINRRRRQRIGADGIRAANLRDKYRISVEEYEALRVGRAGRGPTPTAVAFKLVVDHCHATGRVRGLLCVGCNAAIGHFRDDVTTVQSALDYLRSAR